MIVTSTNPEPAPNDAGSGVDHLRARGALATLVAAAILIDLTLTTPLDGWAALTATAVTVADLVTVGGVRTPQGRAVTAAALAPALFLPCGPARGWWSSTSPR